MTLSYKVGDLMEADETAIAHGCNTQGVMGAGVALLVRNKYPYAYRKYLAACDNGDFRVGSAQAVWATVDRLVYNLGTQQSPGKDATQWGVFLSFATMAEHAARNYINTIAIPRVAAGIGGLRFDEDVVPAIAEALDRSSHPNLTIVVYDLPGNTE